MVVARTSVPIISMFLFTDAASWKFETSLGGVGNLAHVHAKKGRRITFDDAASTCEADYSMGDHVQAEHRRCRYACRSSSSAALAMHEAI